MCNTFNKGGTRSKSFNFAGTLRRILVNRGNKLNGRAAGPGPADRARLRSARLQEIKKGLEPSPPKPVGPQLSPPRVPRRYSPGPLIIFAFHQRDNKSLTTNLHFDQGSCYLFHLFSERICL